MFTIAAQNIHQATPAIIAAVRDEAVRIEEGFILPVPLAMILFKPWQRVSLWGQLGLNPFELFFDGLAAVTPQGLTRLEGFDVPYGGFLAGSISAIVTELKKPHGVALLPMAVGGLLRHGYFMRNVEGALDLSVMSVDADLVRDMLGRDPVRFSFVQEFVASAVGCPVGMLYITATQIRISKEDERLFSLPDEEVEPDPWLTDDGKELSEEYRMPMLSLPLGRWTRELSSLLARGAGGIEGTDPWLEGLARPLMRSWGAFQTPSHDRVASAQQGLVGLAGADWAQAAWEWLDRSKAST